MENLRGKKHFRCYAHANSFKSSGFNPPDSPEIVDWNKYFQNGEQPEFIDIGCGYGRFLFKCAALNPTTNVLGLEIRDKVVEFVEQHTSSMDNCAVIRTNALLFFPNYFKPHSLRKIFVLFPDPHFKKRKQKGRIICRQMMRIFQYLLAGDGQLYISTDVQSLFDDMCQTIEESGIFIRDTEAEDEELFALSYKDTDEAHRAGVKTGCTMGRIYKVIKE